MTTEEIYEAVKNLSTEQATTFLSGAHQGGIQAFKQTLTNMYELKLNQVQGITLKDWYAGLAMQALISDPEMFSADEEKIARNAWAYANKMLDRASGEGMVDVLRERLANAEKQVAEYNEKSRDLCAAIKPRKWEGLIAAALRLVEERDKWREAALKLKNASINRESTGYVVSGVRDALNGIMDLELAEGREVFNV